MAQRRALLPAMKGQSCFMSLVDISGTVTARSTPGGLAPANVTAVRARRLPLRVSILSEGISSRFAAGS